MMKSKSNILTQGNPILDELWLAAKGSVKHLETLKQRGEWNTERLVTAINAVEKTGALNTPIKLP